MNPEEPHRRRPARLLVGATLAVALLGGGAVAVSAATRTSSTSATAAGYRTALVTERSVRQTLDNVGVIEPVAQASVAFPTSGTVSSVDVKVGDTVSVGQRLARLSTTALEATLIQDQASLAAAKLTLHQALNGETITASGSGGGLGGSSGGAPTGTGTGTGTTRSATSTGTPKVATASLRSTATTALQVAVRPGPPGSTTPTSADQAPTTTPSSAATGANPTTTTTTTPAGAGSGSGSRPSGSGSGGAGAATGTGTGGGGGATRDPALTAAQQAVLDGQQQVDADLATASRDLATANQLCQAAGTTTTTSDPATTTTTDSTTTTQPADPSAASSSATAACTAALQQVLTDQQTVARDQAALATASTKLDDLITASATSSGAPTSAGGTGRPSSSGSGTPTGATGGATGLGPTGATANGGGAGATTTASSPSAEQLVAYQAAVDTATLQVEVAVQGVAQATIVTPIAGQVASVTLTPGSKVSAGSSTANVVIVGQGGYEVTTTVSVDNVSKVKVGQAALVAPDGTDTTITGKVVSIGVAADTSGSTTTYSVVIGFSGRPGGLRNGSTADVRIVTATSAKTLAVPSSAVSAVGTGHRVTVVSKGKASEVQVEVGAIGPDYTAVTSGLSAGQTVALADLSQPLPSQATSSSNGTGTRTGTRTATGFGGAGGGFPPGGFGGQRPGG